MESVFCAVLGTSFSVTLLLMPILLLSPLLEKYFQPKVSCFLWAIVAVRLLLPTIPGEQPQISIPVPSYQISLEQEEMPEPVVEITSTSEVTKIHGEIQVQRKEIPFMEILSWTWLGGTGLSLLVHAVLYQKTRRKILRWSIKVQDERTMEVFKHCKKECGIKREISLYQCSILSTPMLMGFWKPMVLLPERKLDKMSLSYVLHHELSHYKRKDLWLKLLILLAQSVHWFHPLVWIMGRRASADIEKACDDAVLKGSGMQARGEYGTVILSFLQGEKEKYLPLTMGFFEQKKQIIRRFETIMDIRKKKKGFLLTVLTAAIAVYSMTFVGFVDAYAAEKESSLFPQGMSQNTEISPKEGEACLTQEEWKVIRDKDPKAYEERQKQFQTDILNFYSAENAAIQKGQMTWPLPGYYVIRNPYGFRYDGTDFHVGIDIADSLENDPENQDVFGEDVVAAADGTVVLTQTDYTSGRGYGMYIILDHGDSLSTVYGHLSKISVQEGDAVKAGQKIGEVGSTGFSTGPHLHFEIRDKGMSADPATYLLPEGKK